jgi:DNA-binding GntR family transcriptional regulator
MPEQVDHQVRVYEYVRQKLLEGRVRSRKDLSRRRLAAELGVSHSCVQVVLGRLEAERLLVSQPKSGSSLRQLDPNEYHNLYDLRELVEVYAVGRAAQWISPDQLDRLQEACDALAKLLDDLEHAGEKTMSTAGLEELIRTEHLFHGTIMDAARNPLAAHVLENLRILNYYRFFAGRYPPLTNVAEQRKTVAEHREVLARLRARDVKGAVRLMRRHLRNGHIRFQGNLEDC